MKRNNSGFILLLLFFFSFAYTTSPAAGMKLVVFFRSSKPPYNFWWSGIADDHCAICSGWCLLHLWRTCSVVWSSSPQGHVGVGTIFSFLCMCALSLLWPERCRAKISWHVKVVCILLLSGFQRCFDDGGLFLVMDAGWWLQSLHD